MAERPPINPFANLTADPTLARMAASSGDNLARMRQGLATQQMTNRGAMNRTNANNRATMAQLGITENIGDLARGLGVTPTVLNRLNKRAKISDISKIAPTLIPLARLGKGITQRPGDTLVNATDITRPLSKVESPTVAEALASVSNKVGKEITTKGFGFSPTGKAQQVIEKNTATTTTKGKGGGSANNIDKDVSKTIIASVLENLKLVNPKVISHVKDKGAIIEHTVNGKRVQSPVTYNNPKP